MLLKQFQQEFWQIISFGANILGVITLVGKAIYRHCLFTDNKMTI